jgi:hypothetical protein
LALGAVPFPDGILPVLLDQFLDSDTALTGERTRVLDCSGEPYVVANEVGAVGVGLEVVDVHLPYLEVPRAISPVVRFVAIRHLQSSFAPEWTDVALQRAHPELSQTRPTRSLTLGCFSHGWSPAHVV